jgi:hypothetical protein
MFKDLNFVGWHECNTQVPSNTNMSSRAATRTPSGNSSTNNSNNNSRTYKQNKFVAFNMKHRKCGFSRVELQ